MATLRRFATSMAAALFVLASTWIGCTAKDELALQAGMTPCELVRYFDYPCDISHATTEDGYVIEVIRVPHGLRDNGTAPSAESGTARHPVLFVPVFAGASDLWFINYPSQSAGMYLISFLRRVPLVYNDSEIKTEVSCLLLGSVVERYPLSGHVGASSPLIPTPLRSFDEIGRFDFPAVVDHVLNATGADRLTLVALSQGVTASLVFLSTRPEYNEKVDLVVAYGPVANVSHIGPPLSIGIPFTPLITKLIYPLSMKGYVGAPENLSKITAKVCEIFKGQLCSLATFLVALTSPQQLNEVYKAKDFVMYDHGAKENQKRYGQEEAPAYPVERITTPWAIFASEDDTIADPRDVKDLIARLGPRVIEKRVIPQKNFRHGDFQIGHKTNDFLHNVAIDIIKRRIGESA
ncbi:hypothetical protein MRX96_055430 [Rhipicephalus microplus]